ncbi:MAG: division/cell wall cluster transcriptional repressor MraZ [Treponema sp.]|jgi:MraZ protein|nr:division/cell wall cluster transcriptional repressor MraZ [Treponema sp.]
MTGFEVGGTYPGTLDEKWRLGIPIKLRDNYQGPLVITLGLQTCAWIMRREVWDRMTENLTGSDGLTEEERDHVEFHYVASQVDVEIDRVGRIVIPQLIRRYAGLTKDCMILNLQDRLEVWDEDLLVAQLHENQAAVKAVVGKKRLR